MKLKLMVTACALAISGATFADSYQVEVSAKVHNFNEDTFGGNEKFHTYELDGTYYFNPVQTDNLPLAEAAYLGKNSNVFATLFDTPRQHHFERTHTEIVGAEFFIPESFLYVKAGALRTSFEHETDNDWFTTVGVTPIDGLLITTSYSHDEGYDANLHAKYVTDFGNGQFINIEAGFTDDDNGTIKEIGGDFYFDRSFSIGGAIANQHSDNSYTVRTRYFFTERFSGELSYTDFPDGSSVTGGLSLRF